MLSHVSLTQLFKTPPGSFVHETSWQEYWSGLLELPCPPPGDLSDPGIEPVPLVSPALQANSLLLSHWTSQLQETVV